MDQAKRAAIAAAIPVSAGIKSIIAGKANVDPKTLRRYLAEDAELRELYEASREAALDLAESQLLSLIRQGNLTAIIFYLKCQGKSRGYVERTEHDLQMVQAVHLPDGTPLPASFMAALDKARQN